MNFIIDIIVILIFLACIFMGYKRGLTKVIIHLLSFILAIIISLILFKPISTLIINNTDIYRKLYKKMKKKKRQIKKSQMY